VREAEELPEHHYQPDRLHDDAQGRPKGAGEFEPINLGRGARRESSRLWTSIIDEYGRRGSWGRTPTWPPGRDQRPDFGDAFFNRLGSTVAEKTYANPGRPPWHMTVAAPAGSMWSPCLLEVHLGWGMNMTARTCMAGHLLLKARKNNGARSV